MSEKVKSNIYIYIKSLTPNIYVSIGRVSLARENEAGGSWRQKVQILHVNV